MILDATVITQTLAAATPVLLVATGAVFGERVGVINIGLEGLMVFGALTAVVVSVATGSPFLALLAAAGAGVLGAAVFAAFAIWLKRDQVIVGTTINFLAFGLTGVWYRAYLNGFGAGKTATELPDLIGQGAGGVDALTLLAFALVPAAHYLLFRTRLGLTIRATGEVPEAASAAGTQVNRLRALVTLFVGGLCGLGGAALSIGIANSFTEGITGGRGFVALAVVVFGRWNPVGAMGAALLFAAADVLQFTLQARNVWAGLPYPVFLAVPYVLTLVALAVRGAKGKSPAALGTAFEQG
ncbi:MAG: ABC transporter permease [Armatimonadetes bacterium]|nr:ABC transporter permease [Armatimonadota bacterium]